MVGIIFVVMSLIALLIAAGWAISAGVAFLLLLGWGGMLGWRITNSETLLLAMGAFRVWLKFVDRELYP